jgi:hypothetical protein
MLFGNYSTHGQAQLDSYQEKRSYAHPHISQLTGISLAAILQKIHSCGILQHLPSPLSPLRVRQKITYSVIASLPKSES